MDSVKNALKQLMKAQEGDMSSHTDQVRDVSLFFLISLFLIQLIMYVPQFFHPYCCQHLSLLFSVRRSKFEVTVCPNILEMHFLAFLKITELNFIKLLALMHFGIRMNR